jgi:hypothetical protein
MKHRPTGSSTEILILYDDSVGFAGLGLSERAKEMEMIELIVTQLCNFIVFNIYAFIN